MESKTTLLDVEFQPDGHNDETTITITTSRTASQASHTSTTTDDDNNLLGFATPSEGGQTMESSLGDLLGFSTPPEAEDDTTAGGAANDDTDDTDDDALLDFSLPPPTPPVLFDSLMTVDAKIATPEDDYVDTAVVDFIMGHDDDTTTGDADLLLDCCALPESKSTLVATAAPSKPPLAGQDSPRDGKVWLGIAPPPVNGGSVPVEISHSSTAESAALTSLGFFPSSSPDDSSTPVPAATAAAKDNSSTSPSLVEAPVEQVRSAEPKGSSRVDDELVDFSPPPPLLPVVKDDWSKKAEEPPVVFKLFDLSPPPPLLPVVEDDLSKKAEEPPVVLPNTESMQADRESLNVLSSDPPLDIDGQDLLPCATGSGLGIDNVSRTCPEEPLIVTTVHTEDSGMMGSSGITTGLLDLIPPKSHGTTKLSMELEKKESSAEKRGEMDPRGQNFHLSTDEANDVIVNDAEEANATGRTESPLCDDENNGEATTAEGDEAEMADVSLAETKQSDGSASVAPPVPSEATLEQQHEISAIVEQVMDPWADAFISNEEASNEITTADNETKAPRAGMPELSAPVVVVVDVPPAEENEQCSSHSSAEKDVLLVELQSSLQDHMLRQAEAEDRARRAKERLAVLEKELRSKVNVEEELKVLKVSMMAVVSDKGHLELELAKLRMARDEHERKEIVLSNRLNAAKKKESVKANLAEQFQEEARELGAELATTQEKLKNTQDALEKSERELRKTREDVAKRVNVAETALSEERRLNDDRKRKMKVFVETKQEEIRLGKVQTDELTAELEQTNRLLREQTGRWKQLHAQWVQSQTRNRELQRDLNRIKKDSDDMHKIGDKMEMKLSRSAQETEEHKNKRLTAKHELMTVLRTLEGEREVSSKLRDSLKFTFTPKALSQQQLLKESLQEFETELQNLSRRLGKPYLPPTDSVNLFSTDDTLDSQADGVALASNDDDADNDAESVLMKNRSAIDSTHLISNLENETQRVSQCIMALTSSIERMHALLHVNGTQTCFTALTGLLTGSSSGSATTTSNGSSLSHDVRAGGRAPVVRARSTRYGQLPTDPN